MTEVPIPSGKSAKWAVLRPIVRNATLVTSSGAFGAICAIVALGFNARALGPKEFGVLAIIQSYVAFISGLSTFESWQPLIRLGVRFPSRQGLLISCGIFLDAAAAVLATVVAIGGILLFAPFVGVPSEYRLLALIYSISLLAGLAGTPKGYFRLKGRYDVLVGNQVGQGLLIVAASALLWALDAPLLFYVIVLSALGAFYNLTLFVRLLFHARWARVGLCNPFKSVAKRRFFSAFLTMAAGTSVLSTLANTRRHIGLFLVAGILGEAASGYYAVAVRLATMVSRIAALTNHVIFPEVIKFSTAKAMGAPITPATVARMTAFAGSVALILGLVGFPFRESVVRIFAGSSYAEASLTFGLLFVAECVALAGIHLNPLIQSLAGTKPLLVISALTIMIYAPLALAFGLVFGIAGVASANVAALVLAYVAMATVVGMLIANQQRSSSDCRAAI